MRPGEQTAPTLPRLLARLERRYGPADAAAVTDPFEVVLLEHVAYLATDERRAALFAELARDVGLHPTDILEAPRAVLVRLCERGGMNGAERAERMRRSATLVLAECDGDLGRALARATPAEARRLARRFDGFGQHHADRLLLFAGVAVPALDSNGLRVLSRVWFGGEESNYAAGYRAATARIAAEGPVVASDALRAYHLLRRHGKSVCRRSAPACGTCPLLRAPCAYGARA